MFQHICLLLFCLVLFISRQRSKEHVRASCFSILKPYNKQRGQMHFILLYVCLDGFRISIFKIIIKNLLPSFALPFPLLVTSYSDNRHCIFILSNSQRILFVCSWGFLGVIMLRITLEEIPINYCIFLLSENFMSVIAMAPFKMVTSEKWHIIFTYHFFQDFSSLFYSSVYYSACSKYLLTHF